MASGTRRASPLMVAIFGPTSSGKTALSIELCLYLRNVIGVEPLVISADSRQVYRYLDIGTSKTTAQQMCGIRHEMIDVAEPIKKFELESYLQTARDHIQSCLQAGGIPIIVGGTAIYLKSLLENWKTDEHGEARKTLRKDFPRNMILDAYAVLERTNKSLAAKVHPQNYDGIINALAHTMSGQQNDRQNSTFFFNKPVRCITLGLDRNSSEINKRVANTFDSQLAQGLFAEICELTARYNLNSQLLKRGDRWRESTNQVLQTHGYREFFEIAHERGKPVESLNNKDIQKIRSLVIEHIQAYTRRQRSAFTKMPNLRMINTIKQAKNEVKDALITPDYGRWQIPTSRVR